MVGQKCSLLHIVHYYLVPVGRGGVLLWWCLILLLFESEMRVMGSDHHPSESATVLDRESLSNNDAVDNTDAVRLRLRLHLVRHGETESNRQNLVLGQTDSVS